VFITESEKVKFLGILYSVPYFEGGGLLFLRVRLSDYFGKTWKKYVEPPVLLFRPEKWRQQVPTKLHGVTCHKAEFLIGEVFFFLNMYVGVEVYIVYALLYIY
jgi:hypothetical protein